MSSYENRRALEAYEKRNAEITPSAEEIAEPNPDNAALLYYQAFLLQPEFDKAIDDKMNKIFGGEIADREVRTYLGHCLSMIHLAEIASRIPQCTWGLLKDTELGFGMWELRSNVYF